jgi:EmrB/QacA subfamily drug resistance transporter
MADNTMVGVAVPRIRDDFRAGVTSLEWVVAGYIVAFAGLLFTGGVLGDRYGRKRALLIGVGIFAGGALISALATDQNMLIVGRIVQGIGAACSEPGTLSLVRQLHPDEHSRARALGGWAAASGVALAAGPVAAGLLLALGGWRAVFFGECVAALIAGAIALALLTESRDPVPGRDIGGQVCAAVALAALVFALIDGQDHGFTSPLVVTAWLLAAAAFIAFIVVEKRSPYAVVDLPLFRDRLVASGLVAATASTFALFSVLLLISLDLQVVGGYSGLATAGVFTPMTVVMVLAGPVGGRWSASRGPLAPLVTGLLVAAAALGVLDHSLGRPVRVVPMAGWLALMGIGLGLVVAPMVGVVLSRLPGERSGMAAAAVTAAREVGGVVGVSALGAVLYARLFSGLTSRLVDLGIPVGYRQIVIDAVRKGSKIPTGSGSGGSPGGQGQGVPFLSKLVASIRQALVDKTVDAGKAAYVAAVRSALVVAVIVLVAGAVGVALLLGQRDRDPDTLPETVRAGV